MNRHFNDEINWQTVGRNYYFRKQRKCLNDLISMLDNTDILNSEVEIIERKIKAISNDIYGRTI